MFTILDCYKKATTQAQANPPRQIIAVGTQWNKHITPLIKEFMNDPYIVITVIEEAAIFGNVQQVKLWERSLFEYVAADGLLEAGGAAVLPPIVS